MRLWSLASHGACKWPTLRYWSSVLYENKYSLAPMLAWDGRLQWRMVIFSCSYGDQLCICSCSWDCICICNWALICSCFWICICSCNWICTAVAIEFLVRICCMFIAIFLLRNWNCSKTFQCPQLFSAVLDYLDQKMKYSLLWFVLSWILYRVSKEVKAATLQLLMLVK